MSHPAPPHRPPRAARRARAGDPAMSIRNLPDFLKRGDPALTFPHGKTYGVNHPKGMPNLPGPITADQKSVV